MRVVIAEDSTLMRVGLETLLARFGHIVVGSVSEADSIVAMVVDLEPDLLITDVRMPPRNGDDGLRAAVEVRSRRQKQPVLVLSQYVEQSYASILLESQLGHGVGYLLKDRVGDIADFVEAAETVAGGGTVLDPDVIQQLLKRRRDPVENLTPREHQVLALMAEGRSNGAIARSLSVTEAAVHKHVSNIFSKFGLAVAHGDNRRVLAVLEFLRI
ncbi:response regulator transcription factor [Rhodococcus sp. IEGM 1381]|uniref:response regulator n=1 Tax=Rhodococcus sp. IEGM 1381 TaxID=3047085 RepID=UPI0024B82016|nr:response regulator transcription factor [Rhodococcus sp. IEGM 1381]MDI9894490.1 response regulator transcription factor [Rhodococcus sp. IEGM 1381]